MSSSDARTALTVAFGVSLFGVTTYLLYLLLKRDEQDDSYSDTVPTLKSQSKVEMRIPMDHVRTVIGRNGSHIKKIEKDSCTKINFKDRDQDENYRICIIRGTRENCNKAESLIHEFIANQPVIEVKDLWVPQIAIARIIGRCGERIHCISDLSGAKIRVTPESGSSDVAERKIQIKGTKEQIEVASKCIMEVVHEDADFRVKIAKREPRGKFKSKKEPGEVQVQKKLYEKLVNGTSSGDGEMEVYVSAVVDPSQFWLQIVGPKANELDQLVEEMTDYYSKPENREMHLIPEPSVGDVVAAIFMFDGKWYRAEISDIVTNDKGGREAQLYYVDYGDTDVVPVDETFELRTDFLTLRFQAIECFLARVKPKGAQWTEEATDCFEEWTQVAQWKKLRARVHSYKERSSCVRSRREGSPIPGVDLYDVNNQRDVDIAMELVKHGLAVWESSNSALDEPSCSSTASRFEIASRNNDSTDTLSTIADESIDSLSKSPPMHRLDYVSNNSKSPGSMKSDASPSRKITSPPISPVNGAAGISSDKVEDLPLFDSNTDTTKETDAALQAQDININLSKPPDDC